MPNFNNWISYSGYYENPTIDLVSIRAILAWGRINDKPTSLSFRTSGGVKLSPQIVRLESDSRATQVGGTSGITPVRKVTIFGIEGHPDLPDTNVKEGYTFFHGGDTYFIQDVIHTLGEVQAIAEARR